MQKAVIVQYEQAENAGDWSLTNNFNLGMPYCQELADPRPNSHHAKMKRLWFFTCAQAFTLVSPRMFEEFMLDYQMPIMGKFGLVSYACCEDITHKIASLRKIPNLRRIGVTPVSNVRKCAEQIGLDYVFSWKPNPADLAVPVLDEDRVRRNIRAMLETTKSCRVELIMKDNHTIGHNPENVTRWCRIARVRRQGPKYLVKSIPLGCTHPTLWLRQAQPPGAEPVEAQSTQHDRLDKVLDGSGHLREGAPHTPGPLSPESEGSSAFFPFPQLPLHFLPHLLSYIRFKSGTRIIIRIAYPE
jgi:hypothetical protein